MKMNARGDISFEMTMDSELVGRYHVQEPLQETLTALSSSTRQSA